MSALGHKQTFRGAIATSALSPKADLRRQGVWSILVASGRSAQEAELNQRADRRGKTRQLAGLDGTTKH
jgi:hypothetical protein